MAAAVISVEHVELVLNGTAVSGSLTKGQDLDNCVPFASHHASTATGGYYDRGFCDVYFSDAGGTSTVRAERPDSSGALTVSVFVVEFDPDEVHVESGEINFAGTSDSSTISGSTASGTVDTDRAAMVFNYQVTGTGSTAAYEYFVRGDLDSTTVSWQRGGTSAGAIEGHYFIFESLNDHFSVRRVTASTAGTTASAVFSDHIYNWRKTFVVGSYYHTYGSDDPQYHSCYGYLDYINRATLRRNAASGSIYFIFFIIEFINTEKTHVEQGIKTLSTTAGVQTDNIDLRRSFDLDYSMVMPVLNEGICRAGGTSYTQNDTVFTGMSFNSASQIAIKRNTVSQSGYTQWQVVDWQGVTHTKASPATPLENTIVKTVEEVTMTLGSADSRKYMYYELTKGQDISNCVVFETHEGTGTGGYMGRLACSVWLEEPNLIGLGRGSSAGTIHSRAYVVEFDPTKVNVQQGQVLLEAVNNNTDTITAVDLDKTAMIHYGEVRGTSTAIFDFFFRGKFNDSTTLEFRRGSTTNTAVISYFVFEAINDEFEVDTYSSSNTGQYNFEMSDAVKKHHTFLISSYYTSYGSDDPQYSTQRCYIIDEHSGYVNGNAYSGTYYHNIFVVKLKYAPEKILVQRGEFTHSTTLTTETVSLPISVDLDSSMVTNPQRVTTRCAGTAYTQNEAHQIRRKFNDVDEIELYRQPFSQVAYSIWEVIDWVGYSPTIYPDNQIQQGIVKSIERIERTISTRDDHYNYLTKGQDITNCVPFPTNSCDSSANLYYEMVPIYYLYEPNIFKTVRRNGGGTIDLGVDIVEFNPNEVRVQSGEIYFTGTNDTATISGVDLDKTFVISYTHTGSSSNVSNVHELRTRFTNSTTLQFTRTGTTDYVRGHYYVIEDIGDNFDVTATEASSATSPSASIAIGAGDGRTAAFGSFYTTDGTNDPQHHGFRLTLRDQEKILYLNKSGSSAGTTYFTGYVVKFKDPRVRVIRGGSTFGTTDTVHSQTIPTVDPDKCMISCMLNVSMGRVTGGTAESQNPSGWFRAYISPDGTQASTERDFTASLVAYSSYQIIEFPMNTHYFSGNVTENNIPATRQVFAYDRATGALEKAVTSSGIGGYYLAETTSSGTHFIIALDDLEGDQFNLMGLDLMDPLPIN